MLCVGKSPAPLWVQGFINLPSKNINPCAGPQDTLHSNYQHVFNEFIVLKSKIQNSKSFVHRGYRGYRKYRKYKGYIGGIGISNYQQVFNKLIVLNSFVRVATPKPLIHEPYHSINIEASFITALLSRILIVNTVI